MWRAVFAGYAVLIVAECCPLRLQLMKVTPDWRFFDWRQMESSRSNSAEFLLVVSRSSCALKCSAELFRSVKDMKALLCCVLDAI